VAKDAQEKVRKWLFQATEGPSKWTNCQPYKESLLTLYSGNVEEVRLLKMMLMW
jgi:hypothetical protein